MPAPVPPVIALALAAAPLLTLLLAAWVVGRSAEGAAAGAGLSRVAIAEMTTPLFVTALVSARIVEILPTWRGVLANPLDLLRFTGAGQLSPLGGVLGAGIGLVVLGRRRGLPLPRIADVYGLALPLGMAVYHGGCVARNDCYGRVAPPPLGIVFPGLELPHYPVGLYAAAAALFVYAGLQSLARRRPAPGSVGLTAVIAMAASYALLAPLRFDGASGFLDAQQAAAVLFALIALVVVQLTWLVKVNRARPVPLPSPDQPLGEGRG